MAEIPYDDLRRERDRLRAEVERLKADRDVWKADATSSLREVERLKEELTSYHQGDSADARDADRLRTLLRDLVREIRREGCCDRAHSYAKALAAAEKELGHG